jgi:hypothetical protein
VRRLTRGFLVLCSWCSFLLCIVTCAAWVRSYRVGDVLSHASRADSDTQLWQRVLSVRSARGSIDIFVQTREWTWRPEMLKSSSKPSEMDPGFRYRASRPPPALATITAPAGTMRSSLASLGFGWLRDTDRDASRRSETSVLMLPHWAVGLAAGLLPAFRIAAWARRRRTARRHASGLCVECAYDLRSSSGRCPECGSAIRLNVSDALPAAVILRRAAVVFAVVAAAVSAWWSHGWWTERQTWARLARVTTPIARFSFNNYEESDGTGYAARLNRINAPIEDGAMILNGIYEYGGRESGEGYRASVAVPYLNVDSFTVSWRFKCAPIDTAQRWNLLTGGSGYRWIVLSRELSGRAHIAFNNCDDAAQEIAGTDLRPGVWYRASVSVNVIERRVLVMLDGKKVADITLPADFAFRLGDPAVAADERAFMFTNYSSGETFAGEVDELTVFSRAMSESELTSFSPMSPGSAPAPE